MPKHRIAVIDRVMMAFYLVWSIAGFAAWFLMGAISIATQYWSVAGTVMSVFGIGVFGVNALCSLRLMFVLRWCPCWVRRAIWLGLVFILIFPISRLLLPWEEPGTGMGSPLAVLLGVFFLFILACMYTIMTGAMGLTWLREYRASIEDEMTGRDNQ